MPNYLECTDEVREMQANFDGLPDAFSQECRYSYLAIAKNKAVQRLVKSEIERIEAECGVLVASGEIKAAADLYNKLSGMRNVLEKAVEQRNNLMVPSHLIAERVENTRKLLGHRLSVLLSEAQNVEPPGLLNPGFHPDIWQPPAGATEEEIVAWTEILRWRMQFSTFKSEFGTWMEGKGVTDLIHYIHCGMTILENYADLAERGKRISGLADAANKQYAKRNRIADMVEAAKRSNSPRIPNRFYEVGACVNFGGNVYCTTRQGTTGMTEPAGAGQDGSVWWILLGPVEAFGTHSRVG